MMDSLLTIAAVVVVGCAALGVWEVDTQSKELTEQVEWYSVAGRKLNLISVTEQRPLTPEATAAGKSCEELIEGLLQISDEFGYNLDWIFFVLSIFDVQSYPWGKEVERALSAGELPEDIKPQNSTTRTKAIRHTCNWVASKCNDKVAIPPRSKNATLFKLSLESVLEPFEKVPSERKDLVDRCEKIMNKLMEYYKWHGISYDFVFDYFLGLNPRFTNHQLCVYSVNIFFHRLEEENKKETRSSKWPHYNIFQISESEDFFEEASWRLERKLMTTTDRPVD